MPSSSSSSGARLVKVAFARSQAEAELIQGLLLESGIPSILKRTRGFDVPDFLAAGPRDVFVAEAVAEKAHGLLADTVIETEGEERAEMSGETELVGLAVAALIVWVLYQLS
jgi:hypothetical protein